ncbi:type-F conjugative transfer system pilin assembly thiol-disulfide isomerase TrbB, partial [Escherichia sp. 14.0985]|nr:type-F conjugative transfer system pilin assembly thiol-disulfide isomerase TrbB [Escherichia sp. 14.0985]MBB2454438.1 type-F conjugative transfer system pilin assembly thiol-disulfide isomerase TrbB [Escherichia sp. 8.2195]
PVTPAAFLVEVNTLKTLPLLYGIVDEQTLRQRIDEALGFAVLEKGKHEIMKKQK